jgi:glyoxylase-like metal-dependent hydrolase (beta-lactamase superfamily II)
VRVERHVVGALSTNCFIVTDDVGGPCVVIDPAGDAPVLLAALRGREVAAVVLTHGHFDHVGAAGAVVEGTGAPLLAHSADADDATDSARNGGMLFGFSEAAPAVDRRLEHDDQVVAGDLTLSVLHTPGHTPGGISLLGDGHLFCGDTVFAGSVGRTDFPGGDARTLRRSIEERIVPLPDATVLHPGHGPDSTVGAERSSNPFFPRG